MAQTVSALQSKSSRSKSGRMSPVALGLALAMHGLAIAAVWWMSPFRPIEPPEDAIVVTVHSRVPSASPDSPAADKPAEPTAAATADPAPEERPRQEPQQAMAAPEPPQPQPPQPEPPRPEPPQPQPPPRPEAAAPPQPPQPVPPPPSPSPEEALAPPQELPPPTAPDVPSIRVPLPPWPSPQPQATPPPPPRPPQPALAPPPTNAPASVQVQPSNSADWLLGKSRARNAYLDQVARLTSKYRRYPRGLVDANQQGRVVTRVTIARDGRLIDVSIDTSSGWPAIDAAELETIRRSAPFPPVPADMPGDPLILILPVNFLALR